MLRVLIALSILLVASAPAYARDAQISGAYLLEVCDMDRNGKEKVKGGHAVCQAYISGVIDYHNVLRSLKIAPAIDICIPKGTTLNDMQDIVLNFLITHAEHDNFVAAPAVTMALYQIWPCRR